MDSSSAEKERSFRKTSKMCTSPILKRQEMTEGEYPSGHQEILPYNANNNCFVNVAVMRKVAGDNCGRGSRRRREEPGGSGRAGRRGGGGSGGRDGDSGGGSSDDEKRRCSITQYCEEYGRFDSCYHRSRDAATIIVGDETV